MENKAFYHRLRARILHDNKNNINGTLWAKYLFLAPDFFYLLMKLAADARVSSRAKAMLAIAIAYFINPFDLIPDFLITVGFLDDIVVASYVLASIMTELNPRVLNEYWAPKRDITEVVEEVCRFSDRMIGKKLLKKISSLLGGDEK